MTHSYTAPAANTAGNTFAEFDITGESIQNLAQIHEFPCITVCSPMEREGSGVRQNAIRMKNQVGELENRLRGIEPSSSTHNLDRLLEPIRQRLDDREFWNHQSEGLVLLLSPSISAYRRLPFPVEESTHIAPYFALRSLVWERDQDLRYFLLAMSQQTIRLFDGARRHLCEVDLSGWPSQLRDIEAFVDPERSLQFHTSGGPTANATRRSSVYHGQGGGEPDEKTRITEFFKRFDETLMNEIGDEKRPLIAFGVKRIISLFRESTRYPDVVEQFVEGNPDHLSASELLTRVQPVIDSLLDERCQELRRDVQNARSSDRIISDGDLIERAAILGLIDTFIATPDDHHWVEFAADESSLQVDRTKSPGVGPIDRVESALVHTMRNSGSVHVLDSSRDTGFERTPSAILRPGGRAALET